MKRKIVSIVVILTLICANSCLSLAAKESDTYKNKANEAASNSKKAQEELKEVKTELNGALQEVAEISDSIGNVESEINTLSNKIDDLKNSISEKEADLKKKETLLDERLAASYMNGGTSPYMDALFSGGVVNLVTNYDMIKQIAEYDNNLINEVKSTKAALEDEKKQSEEAKEEKEKKSEELKGLKSQKQAKVNSLTAEQKEIQSKIDEYDAETKKMQKLEKDALAKEKAAEEAARRKAASSSSSSTSSSSRSSSTVSKGSGQFMWPVPSSHSISSPYGYRVHPIYGTKKFHSGIDIPAPTGTTIVAADSGTVILASYGYNGGYGNYVIVSHGNGYTTRYAHCSSLSVSVGQQVSKGQKIASVGSTGASTGPHCHFEVRINGETQNPSNYV